MKKTKQLWTISEEEALKEVYATSTKRELEKQFNRSASKIYNKAYALGLKKSVEIIAKQSFDEWHSNPFHGSRATMFRKGQTPPNKGKRQPDYMSQEAIERTKATRFSKGDKPHNYKLVGSTRVTDDGYIEVKVKDPKTWKLKHRVVWESKNGKIPPGCNIQFKDGNRANCNVSNLYIISRKEQINNNSIVRYPSEVRAAIHAVNKLTKTINKYEKPND